MYRKKSFTLSFKALFKMEEKQHLEDLKEIRSLMERSTRFISLSGLSGVLAGLWAIAGAVVAHYLIQDFMLNTFKQVGSYKILERDLLIVAICVLVGAIGSAIFFTLRKAKKDKAKIWNKTSKKLLINLAIPLLTGGIIVLFLIQYQMFVFFAPFTLIFYGLACVNASHNTFTDIRYLGITVIVVGLLNMFYLGYGLYFWAFGFGVLHILYGAIMYFKYER